MSTRSSVGLAGVSKKNAVRVRAVTAPSQASMSRPSISVEAMPKRGQQRLDDVAAGAEHGAGGDDVVAGLEERQQARR